MPLWKMEQITPYFEKEGSHTKLNPIGDKLVKDCLTNSEIGTIGFIEAGGTYKILKDGEFQEEKISSPTIIAQTVTTVAPVYRDDKPDMYSYEKAAQALYNVYWRHLSIWGKFHRLSYRWSLPTIALSLVAYLAEVIVSHIVG